MKLVRGFVVFAAIAAGAQLGAVCAEAPVPGKPEEVRLTADEALVVRMINAERCERSLRPLTVDSVLTKVAREHSQDMAERGYFSHLAPEPTPHTPLDRYAAALGRRPEAVVGENIGRSGEPVMGMIHARMMESAEHRANILDREYAQVGVGIHCLGGGGVWVTEMFCGPLPETR